MNNDRFFGHDRFSRQSKTPAEYASALERPAPRAWGIADWCFVAAIVVVVAVAVGALVYAAGVP